MVERTIFSLSDVSSEPIYMQIVAQVRRRVAGGQLQAGDELPSVRELAKTLRVNPMTVSKAFGVLVAERLVIHRPGMPMVIAEQHGSGDSAAIRAGLLRPTLVTAVREVVQLGLRTSQALDLFRSVLREHELD